MLRFALLVILSCATAHADIRPTVAIRAGAHHTTVAIEPYVTGEPRGAGVAAELEGGVALSPAWRLTAFLDVSRFHADLGFEYPEFRNAYDTTFSNLYWGARAAWHSRHRVFVAASFGRVDIRQRSRPLSSRGVAFDWEWNATVLQATIGVELARTGAYSLQLSISLGTDPQASDYDELRFELYVPVFLGVQWN